MVFRHFKIALLAPAFVLALGLVAACVNVEPTPTPAPPTPTSTPSPTPTATPTPMPPTPTPTATPIPPTPTPTPSPTPSPTPTPTPTPTPSPTPTPTPTPTQAQGIALAEPAIVKLIAGDKQWTGFFIEGTLGRILTTSSSLGQSPLADFYTPSGSNGRAWVIGRDDNLDLALLEVISPGQVYPSFNLAKTGDPQLDQDFVLLRQGGLTDVVQKNSSRIIGSRQDFNTGLRYIQLQGLSNEDSDGSALIDNSGLLRGIRMNEQHMLDIAIGRTGEIYALSVDGLISTVIPRLETGVSIIDAPLSGTSKGTPPSIPAIFKGTIKIDSRSATKGTRVYAKVSKVGSSDLWFSTTVEKTGEYLLPISISRTGYTNATVQFWAGKYPASATSIFVAARTTTINIDVP